MSASRPRGDIQRSDLRVQLGKLIRDFDSPPANPADSKGYKGVGSRDIRQRWAENLDGLDFAGRRMITGGEYRYFVPACFRCSMNDFPAGPGGASVR